MENTIFPTRGRGGVWDGVDVLDAELNKRSMLTNTSVSRQLRQYFTSESKSRVWKQTSPLEKKKLDDSDNNKTIRNLFSSKLWNIWVKEILNAGIRETKEWKWMWQVEKQVL